MKPKKLLIEAMSVGGAGLAAGADGPITVPYALPGESVMALVDGERGTMQAILEASDARVSPFCPHFTQCGGCAIQHWRPEAYAAWKHGLVVQAMQANGIRADVAGLVDGHGSGRRRVTFHARFARDARRRMRASLGFMRHRSHDIIAIDACPLLDPGLAGALGAARALVEPLAALGKPVDVHMTATLDGMDVDLRGTGEMPEAVRQALMRLAGEHDLARLSQHGLLLIERRRPRLQIGPALVTPPAGAFLQATALGEATLARLVEDAINREALIADLFAGIGTFALRLASRASVHAYEMDQAALGAGEAGAHAAQGLREMRFIRRDLFRNPLMPHELKAYEALVLDPPRAGALEQMREIAAAQVPLVVSVSCNLATFARDAKVLIAAGYVCEGVTPVDQFRHSAHLELVGVFRKAAAARRRSRPLLG
ncbi:MAG: RNA methyltransferase [Hyphomicrobiales bacterium]|nr:RNA methyltransferase [Hyphomicrobiales bacterium]